MNSHLIFWKPLTINSLLLVFSFLFALSGCAVTLPRDVPIEAITTSTYQLAKPNNLDQEGNLIQLEEFELVDFEISATRKYYYDYWHRATPISIPNGKLITTTEVLEMLALNNTKEKPILIDVRSDDNQLITAKGAVWLNGLGYAYRSIPNDAAINFRMNRELNKITQNNKNRIIIFMCANPICALSYNAALRAIKLGYQNVYWYRGGIEAWTIAGLPLIQHNISEKLLLKFQNQSINNNN